MDLHICIHLKGPREEFKDIKGLNRIRISKKNRQHNGQKKKNKRTNNDLQNMHIKLKSNNTNPTTTGVNPGAPEEYAVPAPLVTPVVLIYLQTR